MSAEHVKDRKPEGSADGEQDTAQTNDPAASLSAVTAERDKLATEKAELHDRFLRAQAEFQNLRRRVEKEKAEFHEYAATEAVRSLVPILDDFGRALKTAHSGPEYAKGMELIYQRLSDTLKKLGLEPIISVGEAFDPHVHHAVDKEETSEVPDGTILEDYERGYNFKGRLLRAAKVKVAVAPADKDKTD